MYLRSVLGDCYREEIIEAFLCRGPEALAFLEDHTDLRYSVRSLSPDYYPEFTGATDCGRALEMGEFDGKRLGQHFDLLRPPPRGMMGFGGMMVNRMDIYHYLHMRHSVQSFVHMAGLAMRFWVDRLRYSRGTRLVIGNAMVAALIKTAVDNGVQFHLGASTESFLTGPDGSVIGVVVSIAEQGLIHVHAKGGVILGTGGLSRRQDSLKLRPDTREGHLTMAAPMADGSMISLAERQLGAQVGGKLRSNFYWAPMSELKERNGAREVFPHIVTDRAKPGVIAVNDKGMRFVDEATSYHRFVEAMRAELLRGASSFYLIADHKALGAYGLGLVRPRPGFHHRFLESGYLMKAPSIRSLAARLNVEPAMLQRTVEEFNRDAERGVDSRFHKGCNSHDRAMGDATAGNPCVAPLQTPPFYAVRIVTGDLGSAIGLMTDANARVTRADGSVIRGLYAVGTDMNSPMSGTYPGPGIVLGTGLTFGYIAARAIADCVQAKRGLGQSNMP